MKKHAMIEEEERKFPLDYAYRHSSKSRVMTERSELLCDENEMRIYEAAEVCDNERTFS